MIFFAFCEYYVLHNCLHGKQNSERRPSEFVDLQQDSTYKWTKHNCIELELCGAAAMEIKTNYHLKWSIEWVEKLLPFSLTNGFLKMLQSLRHRRSIFRQAKASSIVTWFYFLVIQIKSFKSLIIHSFGFDRRQISVSQNKFFLLNISVSIMSTWE